jgi:hypothetical protein
MADAVGRTNEHLDPNSTFAVGAVPVLHHVPPRHGDHPITAIQAY